MVNVVPGDDVVEACGGRSSDGKYEPPVESFLKQPQDFFSFLAGRQESRTRGAAVPHPRVWVLRLEGGKEQNTVSKKSDEKL